MDEREVAELRETLAIGLKKCFEDMLERMALLGQSIVTCDADGNTLVIPTKQALADYRAGKSRLGHPGMPQQAAALLEIWLYVGAIAATGFCIFRS